MAVFQTVEQWQGSLPGGTVTLWLKHLEDVFSDVWRVETTVNGAVPRKGLSFDTEPEARAEAERIRSSLGDGWWQLD